jgi:hypothetical protein
MFTKSTKPNPEQELRRFCVEQATNACAGQHGLLLQTAAQIYEFVTLKGVRDEKNEAGH